MPEPEFVEGEPLIWSSRIRPDEMVTKRPVSFREMKNNMCVVAYGLRPDGTGEPFLYSVLPQELARPVPHRQLKPTPTPEPVPPVPLEQRRTALRFQYESYCESQTEVEAAQQLVTRAQDRVNKIQTELRTYADLEAHAIDAVVHELKFINGGVVSHSVADDDEQWAAREKIKRDCQAAEMALNRFASELADVKAIASERLVMLQKSAAVVVAGILEREIERLEDIEMEAAELRTQLRAASTLWFAGQAVPVAPSHAKVLIEPPAEVREGVGERLENNEYRQQHYAELFVRLVNGEVDADLPGYDDSDL